MKQPSWLTRNVLFIGFVSLFTDMATEMAMPLMPAFIASLGGGALVLGLMEGSADAISSVLKLFSGRWSDHSGKRRPWVLGGYLLSSLARPFLAMATHTWHLVLIRVTDRTGKGLRSAPRDALLAAAVPERQRGAAFGFHQGMDHAGAVLGPLIAIGLLFIFPKDLRRIFWLAAIPGLLAVLTVWFFVKEDKAPKAKSVQPLGRPPQGTLSALIPLGLFALGGSSDLFLLKKAGDDSMPLWGLPLLWVGLHLVKSLGALPGGRLSDKIGPQKTIGLGWLVYAAIYLGFAFVESQGAFIALFFAYGLYYGFTDGAEKAWIAGLVGKSQRGTAFGWYYLVTGILALPASLFFGWLYDSAGPRWAFLSGAGFASLGLASLLISFLMRKARA